MGEAPTDSEVVAALRDAAVHRRLVVHPRAQDDIDELEYDNADVIGLIGEYDSSELDKSEPDDDPQRPYWIAVLRIELEDLPIYAKVALLRPQLRFGKLLSFKRWRE